MTTRETNVNGHRVLECEERRYKLVYVDDRMVTTDFDATIALLEAGKEPEFESDGNAMNRVTTAVFGSAR
jgi:hypothetical protein